METERAGLIEGLAENLADVWVVLIRVLVQTFVRVRQKMPFEEWFEVYLEEQGYLQEEFKERMRVAQEEFERLTSEEQYLVFLTAFQKVPKKIERLEIPKSVKEFFSNLITLVKHPTVEQSPVYECDVCHQQFSPPPGWAGQNIKCPSCGKEWTKEELPKLKR